MPSGEKTLDEEVEIFIIKEILGRVVESGCETPAFSSALWLDVPCKPLQFPISHSRNVQHLDKVRDLVLLDGRLGVVLVLTEDLGRCCLHLHLEALANPDEQLVGEGTKVSQTSRANSPELFCDNKITPMYRLRYLAQELPLIFQDLCLPEVDCPIPILQPQMEDMEELPDTVQQSLIVLCR